VSLSYRTAGPFEVSDSLEADPTQRWERDARQGYDSAMADSAREDRIILTVGAIGRGIASDPEIIGRMQTRLRLEDALEPFRAKRRKEGRKKPHSFGEVLQEGRTARADD